MNLSFYAGDTPAPDAPRHSLEWYDGHQFPLTAKAEAAAQGRATAKGDLQKDDSYYRHSLHLEKDGPRTWARDKALLVELGVDGDVPLAQARVNAGLDRWPGVMIAADGVVLLSANDNHKIAARAA